MVDTELDVKCVKCGGHAMELVERCGGAVVFVAGECHECGHNWSCDNVEYFGTPECTMDNVRNNRAPKMIPNERCVSCNVIMKVIEMDDYAGIGHLCKGCQTPERLEQLMARLRKDVHKHLLAANKSKNKHDYVGILRDSLMIKMEAH